MASISGFCSSLYNSATFPALTGFFESTRMAAWTFHDAAKWCAKLQPESTREYLDLTNVGSLADAVEDFCDGPYEFAEHAYAFSQQSAAVLSAESGNRSSTAYKAAKEGLSMVNSGANTVKLLNRVGAVDLGENLNSVMAVGTGCGLIKATAEIREHGIQYRNLAQRAGESDQSYNRRASISFLEVVKKVSIFALKAFSLAGIVCGIAVSSTLMLTLSTALLTSFMAISFLQSAQSGAAHAGERAREAALVL